MATGEASEATPAAIAALAAQVDGMRAIVRGMHAELRECPGQSSEYGAAVNEISAATRELIGTQRRLRELRLAHEQRLAAQRRARDRVRTRRRLWLLTGLVTLVGVLVVLLAASGAIAASRLAIGVPVLGAGALMAASMTPRTVLAAGRHALDVRKAATAGALAVIALLGALVWRPLGYACVLAVAVTAVPVLAARETRNRPTVRGGTRRG